MVSTPVAEIPLQEWLSDRIDWSASALNGREGNFIWVHVSTEDMLSLFPPNKLIKPGGAHPIDRVYAVIFVLAAIGAFGYFILE